jgi:hypothetical protein
MRLLREDLLDVILELIEDEYLMQHIVFDYRNRRLLKEKQRFVLQKLAVDEQPEKKIQNKIILLDIFTLAK